MRPISPTTKFIRRQSFDLPMAEVVKLAAKAGFPTTESNVSRVRSEFRKQAKSAQAKHAAATKTGSAPKTANGTEPSAPASTSSSDETEFRRIVVRIGTDRAEAIIADVKAKVAALVLG